MKRMMLALIASALLSGCALTTDRIDLSYTPQQGVHEIQGVKDVVVAVNVSDQRQDKSNKVSCKKNAFGMEMAPILANEDVTVTIKKAIEEELKLRGFKVGSDALVSITADLTRFWNDHKVGFFAGDSIANLNMSVLVKNKNGNILYSRQIIAQGVEPNIQLMTGKNARLALDRALANGIRQLFDDYNFVSALTNSAEKS